MGSGLLLSDLATGVGILLSDLRGEPFIFGPTDPDRIFTVGQDMRIVTVSADPRVFPVPTEDRTYTA